MKKLTKIIALLLMSIFFISCFDNEEKIANKIKANLKAKYGEEFVLYGLGKKKMGNGRSWYECRIIPAKYVDTPKFLDDYYWAEGFYSNGNPGDSYGLVKLKESMNEFYKDKIEELFGPNYLMALVYDGSPDFTNWKDELQELNEFYKSQEEYYKELNIVPSYEPIRGTIYIFGKSDRNSIEEYREKIFEFTKYLKEINSFEYTALWIVIIDERVLSDDFIGNFVDQVELLSLYREKGELYRKKMEELVYKNPDTFDSNPEIIEMLDNLYKENGEDYLRERAVIMNKYTKSYEVTSNENKLKVIDGYEKVDIERAVRYNFLLVSPLFSPKYIMGNKTETIKYNEYEKKEDIIFTKEFYYRGEVDE